MFCFNDSEGAKKYEDMEEHTMKDEIVRCRRIAGRQLGLRLCLFERVNTVNKTSSKELDANISQSFMAGLQDARRLPPMKIMGALLHPLTQNDSRMVAAGLCTQAQYDDGKVELLDRCSRHHERNNPAPQVIDDSLTNEWSKNDFLDGKSTPLKKAEDEYKLYVQFMSPSYLPKEMKPFLILGSVDAEGQPRDRAVYSIGPVVKEGVNLPSGHNHAEYIDKSGHYNLVKYLEDHKTEFPAIHEIGIGQICPHISTEVDCESLFSQAGFVADPRRSKMKVRLYERLVSTKHRLGRIYCHVPDVKELYMKRWKDNDWDESEERDADEFLDLEKKIYLKAFPYNKAMFEDEDDDMDEVEIVEGMNKSSAARSKRKTAEEDREPALEDNRKPAAKSKEREDEEQFLGLDFEDQL